jgi:microcystin-dependent protein
MAFHVYSSDCPTGTIKDYAGGTVPDGFLLCDGSTPLVAAYPRLSALLSTTYGPLSGGTFTLPDSRGRGTVAAGTPGSNTTAVFGTSPGAASLSRGDRVGEQTHVLSTTEMPTHSHGGATNTTDVDHTHNYDRFNGIGVRVASDTSGQLTFNADTSSDISTGSGPSKTTLVHSHVINPEGSGGSHFNVQPSLVVTKMIRY